MGEQTQRVSDQVRLKIELELDGALVGDTLPRSKDRNDPEPLLLVSRSAAGQDLYFRHDIPDTLRTQLRELPDGTLNDVGIVEPILAEIAPVTKVINLCWYVVERTPETHEFPDVTMRNGRFVVLVDRRVAAQAWAERTDERAEEVTVATVPAYRGRGYGRQVVAAWMHAVRTAGKSGFYSHLAANNASRALARSVGVTWLSDEVEYIHKA